MERFSKPAFEDMPVFEIVYVSARKKRTVRRVHPIRFDLGTMYARCLLRNAFRAFSIENIEQVTCPIDGIVYDTLADYLEETLNPDEFASVRADVDFRPLADEVARPVLDDRTEWLISAARVLYWLASIDGEIAGEEALAAEDFLDAGSALLGEPISRQGLRFITGCGEDIIQHFELEPTVHALKPAPPEFHQAFWRSARRILDADGHQHEAEFRAMLELQEAWAAPD